MDIELYHKYILCLYQYESLTKAARVLGISQPALSAGLSNLEKKIGIKIFDRKSTPIKPTKEGRVYIEYIQKQRLLWQECQKKVADMQNARERQVIVGAPAVYARTILANAAVKVRRLNPDCNIVIKEASLPELIEKSRKGEVDCFISTSTQIADGHVQEELGMERIYLCIPKGWEINAGLESFRILPGETGECFDYQMLKEQEFIFLEEKQPLQKEMDKLFRENGFLPKSHLMVDQVAVALKLAALGSGIALASEVAIRESGHLDDLCIYSLPPYISGRMIYVAYDKERYLAGMCTEFISMLKTEIGEQKR